MSGARQRGWLVGLGLADVLLVAVLAILVLRSLGPGAAQAPTAAVSGSVAASSAGPISTTTGSAPVSFRMPSGNIDCTVAAGGVVCVIAQTQATAPAGCTGVGLVVTLGPDGLDTPCSTPTPPADDAPELAYGHAVEVGDYSCASADTGVTCLDPQGHGFRLNRAGLERIG